MLASANREPEDFGLCSRLLELSRPLLRPALDHHLRLSVELDPVATLGVQIAEEALLPAREGKECHRRSYADVDADVARPRFIPELARRRAAAGEQTGHVAVAAAVHQRDRGVDVLDVHQA